MFPNTSLWNIDISNNKSLPEGLYAFLEFYCGNPECDCNAGSYHMVEINPQGQILGNIIAEIILSKIQISLSLCQKLMLITKLDAMNLVHVVAVKNSRSVVCKPKCTDVFYLISRNQSLKYCETKLVN